MEKEPIFLALGTNLGDREGNLSLARQALEPQVKIIQESPIYVTRPWGYVDQPDFLNQVLEVTTDLEPLPLLHFLKNIEERLGRLKTFRNGPRLIDLDILFYGQRVIAREDLWIPHPRIQDRAFVLVPLMAIAPDFIHPLLNMTVEAMLANLDAEGVRPL